VSDKDKLNGGVFCPVHEDWPDFQRERLLAMEKVEDIHMMLGKIMNHVENLDELKTQTLLLRDVKDGLLGPATGRDQIPVNMVRDIMKDLTQTRVSTMKILGIVIIGLVIVIMSLLTGENFGFIKALFHAITQ